MTDRHQRQLANAHRAQLSTDGTPMSLLDPTPADPVAFIDRWLGPQSSILLFGGDDEVEAGLAEAGHLVTPAARAAAEPSGTRRFDAVVIPRGGLEARDRDRTLAAARRQVGKSGVVLIELDFTADDGGLLASVDDAGLRVERVLDQQDRWLRAIPVH